jgi:AcrR family transcriptional regulator
LAKRPGKAPRRRLPPEQRRLELLEAGERIIRAQGRDARVEDIVQAADASKGTFFVYFKTWESFLLELRDRIFRDLDERFERYRGDCADWVELIGGLPALFIDLTLSLEGLHAAVLHGPVEHVAVSNPRLNVRSRLADVIAEGIDRKALQAPDVAATTQFLFALLHQAADLAEAGHDRDQVASALRQLLLNAFKVKRVRLRSR